MIARIFSLGAAAALLVAGGAYAEDARPLATQEPVETGDQLRTRDQLHTRDAAKAALHEALQAQVGAPKGAAQLPDGAAAAAGDLTRTRERAGEMAQTRERAGEMRQTRERAQERTAETQQAREAARQRATARGAQDAAMTRDRAARQERARSGSMHGGPGAGGGDCTQEGAGMQRTGTMHGGTGGMMPGSGSGPGSMMPMSGN